MVKSYTEKLPLSGEVRIYETEPTSIDNTLDFGEQVRKYKKLVYKVDNLIVTVGKRTILDFLLGAITNGTFHYMAVGTGLTLANDTDTDLEAILGGWAQYTDRHRAVDDGYISRDYKAPEAIGVWKEAGVKNKSNILISRANISYTKTANVISTLEWRYYWA